MTDSSLARGTVLARRFRLEDLLQETSGAKFWRATDQTLARSVAVHVVEGADPRAEALLGAARVSATVSDVHFLRVLDAAKEDGFVYVVNEWSAGSSLDLLVANDPLPARTAAWLVKEVAEAITAAHSSGIAHGRLLPENVMVTETGSVKLIGFVIDAVLNRAPESSEGAGGAASEAALVGQESDVFNLASLLYAALVGRWPGTDGSALPDAPREHGRPLRPRQVRAGVPRPLDAICDRVLNADAHQNGSIGTAHEICAALCDYIGDPTSIAATGHEPTTVLPREELSAPGDSETTQVEAGVSNTTETPSGRSGSSVLGGGGPPWSPTGAIAAGASSVDPEATQAGAPLFFDDASSIGWAAPGEPASGSGAREGARRTSPPPILPPAPDVRPLFAPDSPDATDEQPRRRDAGGADRPAHGTGHGTGSLPAVWGPDADRPAPAAQREWEPKRAGKGWLKLAAVIAGCAVLVIVVLFAFNLGRGSGEPPTPAAPSGSTSSPPSNKPTGPLPIANVGDFDPQGDPAEENPELAPLAIDGDPRTAWQTVTYFNNPQLGLLKDGVGLVVDLGKPVEVSAVQLTLIGRPTSLQVLAAPKNAALPTSTTGLDVVAEATDAGAKVALELDTPVTSRYLVVWLTSVPPAEGGYVGQIAEIVVQP